MAFDMGFNFRGTSGYVTDPAYGVPVLAESYSHTYTNGNGDSINAGWSGGGIGSGNVSASNDPRLAGYNYAQDSGATQTFTVDLSSGSAPGAGDYTIDFACGDTSTGVGRTCDAQIKDNTTLLIDLTNGGAGFATAAGHFIDATGADVTASTSWTGATASKTFATTTVKLLLGLDNIGNVYSTLAHFRLTLASAPAGLAIPVAMHQYRQRRA